MKDALPSSLALAGICLSLIWLLGDGGRQWPETAGFGLLGLGVVSSAMLRKWDRSAHAGDLLKLARRSEVRMDEVQNELFAERALTDRLPDPLFVLRADNSLTRTNTAARTTYGASWRAVLRQPGLRMAIDQARIDMKEQRAHLTLPVPVACDVLATVIPLATPLTDGGQIVVLLSDCTQERSVEKMRADFVANASHELRTPLASLMGFIETLRGPAAEDAAAQQRFLRIMAEQAARMNRLIDDLLNLSRIELREHQPPTERLSLPTLIRSFVHLAGPQISESGVKLTLSFGQGLREIIGDKDQLVQVLQNLLDNAIKFGRNMGQISISVDLPNNDRVWRPQVGLLLKFQDNGYGIPRVHLPRLTERFYRVTDRPREVKGTGLGLAIVKHIIIRHRGVLHIDSIEGEGTTVTIWLPAAETENVEVDAT